MQSPAGRSSLAFSTGQSIYGMGTPGAAWRVRYGVVRLDRLDAAQEARFASLAVRGDIIGCESMLFGCYAFSATSMTECTLDPWPEGVYSEHTLLESIAQTQQRAAELLSLRGGQAVERVLRLLRLLSDTTGNITLPTRQDIADITDLRFETISRIIKKLEQAGIIASCRIEGVHATRSFRLNHLQPIIAA